MKSTVVDESLSTIQLFCSWEDQLATRFILLYYANKKKTMKLAWYSQAMLVQGITDQSRRQCYEYLIKKKKGKQEQKGKRKWENWVMLKSLTSNVLCLTSMEPKVAIWRPQDLLGLSRKPLGEYFCEVSQLKIQQVSAGTLVFSRYLYKNLLKW